MKHKKSSSERVMATAAQRLRFVVRFAALDLAKVRPFDLVDLRFELADFLLPTHASLRPGGLHLWPIPVPDDRLPEEYSRENFMDLQHETVERLTRAAIGRETTHTPVSSLQIAAARVRTKEGVVTDRYFLSAKGGTKDLFLLGVDWLLATMNTTALALCPVCSKIFLRKHNQLYCSRPCTNYVSHQRWRERQDATATTFDTTTIPASS